jgi:hypothetical protein
VVPAPASDVGGRQIIAITEWRVVRECQLSLSATACRSNFLLRKIINSFRGIGALADFAHVQNFAECSEASSSHLYERGESHSLSA